MKTYRPKPLQRFPDDIDNADRMSMWTLLAGQRLPSPRAAHRPPRSPEGQRLMKQMPSSKTQRFLKNKKLPGHEAHGGVRRVLTEGTNRLVSFQDGTQTKFKKKEFVHKFKEALRRTGFKNALQSIRTDPHTGEVTAVIGGRMRGETRTYQSVVKAKAAIRRIYKQPAQA